MRALAALFLLFLSSSSSAAPKVDLPFTIVTLENGLTLVMQPDPSMPQVGVELWIRGGSREEGPGQHGIAHLFEHNLPASGKFLGNPENRARRSAAIRAGGAGTQPDFLRFYSTASPEGLEGALGYLADRMQSDPAKFTAESVRRDHDIVVSELRRATSLEWDVEVLAHLHRGTFGADHPYGHSVSGSEADVRAATAETMREWHRRYAGAANAIVFVAGNFDPARAEALVRHHFGPIAPGTPLPRTRDLVPAAQARRDILETDVTKAQLFLRWPVPAWGTADADHLTLLAFALNDRLAAHDARARIELWELTGAFTIRGDAEDERVLRETLARLLREGPAADELARAKAREQTDFVRMLQRPVWRGSRADVLGFGLMFRGDAGHYQTQLARIAAATADDVRDAGRRWLGVEGYALEVVPRRKLAATAPIDRAATIAAVEPKPVPFPRVERSGNAWKVERTALPLAQLTFAYDRGADLEPLKTQFRDLGAEVTTDTDADFATLSVSVLAEHAQAVVNGAPAAPAAATKKAAEAAASPLAQRYRVLECVIADCDAAAPASPALRVFVASGDAGNVTAPRTASGAPATRPLKVPAKEEFHIVDYPAATQAHILLAQVLPAAVAKDPLEAQLVLSHALRTRLMDNLRSAKGWSYEIYPFGVELRRGGALVRYQLPVQTEKTAEAVLEVKKEIARLRDEPVSPEFLRGVKSYLETTLTGGLMSLDQLNEQILDLARNDLPPDYYATALRRLQTIGPEDVQRIARTLFQPDRLIWIIAGERRAIERELKELVGVR